MTDVFARTDGFDFGVALVTQRSIRIFDETGVGQLDFAHFAPETFRMPTGVHRLDDASDDEVVATAATRREQHLEVPFAIFAIVKLVENPIAELLEALGAPVGNNHLGISHSNINVKGLLSEMQ